MTTIIDGSAGVTFPAGSNPQGAPSKILQVVNSSTSTAVTTTSTSLISTGLTASITPLFSTSKILVLVSIASIGSSTAGCGIGFSLYRNGSQIEYFINNAPYGPLNSGNIIITGPSTNFLDSPATTSTVNYGVYFASDNGGTVVVQRANTNSTITLLEIAQ